MEEKIENREISHKLFHSPHGRNSEWFKSLPEDEKSAIKSIWRKHASDPIIIGQIPVIINTITELFRTVPPATGIMLPQSYGYSRIHNYDKLSTIVCYIYTNSETEYSWYNCYYSLEINYTTGDAKIEKAKVCISIDPEIILTPGFDMAMHLRNIQ